MSKEPTCAKQHATPIKTENVATGPGQYPRNGSSYIFPPAIRAPTAPSAGRALRPEGLPVHPARPAYAGGQQLQIYNDDQTSHNIHPLAKVNPEWNKSQPPGSPPIETKYEKPEFIPVKCNIHPWMHGYFVVLKHFALSRSPEKMAASESRDYLPGNTQ